MTHSENTRSRRLLLMIAGVKGTVASTVAVAVAAMKKTPEAVLPSLTTSRGTARKSLGAAPGRP
jgi:NhaP-type Na+/H+ or K+/H+ antiporter